MLLTFSNFCNFRLKNNSILRMFEDEELASDTDDEDFVPEVNETVLAAIVKINSSRQNAS